MNEHPDVIVIGSGIGGGATALRLARNGVKVLLLERGDWIAQEPDNWEVPAVFFDKKYTADDRWYDGTGTIFRPNIYYNVGGATKFYGAAMIRLRERDFDELSHEEGVSPAWPISYADIEPYYGQAEQLFKVHGDDSGDITAPRRSAPYPFPKIAHEPIVQTMADALLRAGVPTSALPLGIDYAPSGACILCKTCDGFPCQLHAKSEAETALVRPALATQNVTLWRNALVQRLILSPDGRTVAAVEVEHEGETKQVSAKIIVVACGAVNSAALLLRSASEAAPGGVANRSDAVGRYYMAHNQTALMGLAWQRNDTVFQKTLMMNQFYFGAPGERYPLGHVQMLGKLQGGMLSANVPFLPKAVGRTMARHSMDLIAFSEDCPIPTTGCGSGTA